MSPTIAAYLEKGQTEVEEDTHGRFFVGCGFAVTGNNFAFMLTASASPVARAAHRLRVSRWNLLHVLVLGMLDLPIDPVLRIRGAPQRVLQRTSDAVKFLKQTMLARPDGPWTTPLQALQDAQDEWSAMEAVVRLEITLEPGTIGGREATLGGPEHPSRKISRCLRIPGEAARRSGMMPPTDSEMAY